MNKLAEQVRETVWPRRGWKGKLGYAALRPLSGLFGMGVDVRNLAYRFKVLRARQAPMPVVSVGNLVVGGTGKTPFTLWLARSLSQRGLRVGILSRGYGGSAKQPTLVSRGAGPEVGADVVGDEPVMLAKSFSGPVVIAARRVAGAALLAELGCEVAVLDDGFQHRAIARTYDIVLVDRRLGPLLPAGPLRERPSALQRADAVVLVDHDGDGRIPDAPPEAAGKLVCRMHLEPRALVESAGNLWRERPIGNLAGQRVAAVCGIARPQGFYEALHRWEASLEEVFEFPDHHRYTPADWQRIARSGHQVDLVVTTEKDLVKLSAFPFATGKLVALRIVPVLDRAEELLNAISARVEPLLVAGRRV
jgi:tetraacyldisaccharide 4'-kinase